MNLSLENLREQIRELAQNDARFTKKTSDAPGAVYSSVWVCDVIAPAATGGSWTAVIQGMDSKYYEVSFSIAENKVVLGTDAKEVTRNVSFEVAAHAAASEIESVNGELPTNLQWMPPGKQTVQPMGFPEPFDMEVTSAMAAAADRQLQSMLEDFARGKDVEPYIDINHEDRVKAFLPEKFSWGGEDLKQGGIRVHGKWKPVGKKAATDEGLNVISPSWTLNKMTKAFIGIKRNLGGLVPRSAFHSIQAFAKPADSGTTTNPTQSMTKEEFKQLLDEGMKPVVDRIATLEANAKDDGAIGKRFKALEDAAKTTTTAQAKSLVEEHGVRAGRVAAQDADTIAFWEGAIAADAKAVDRLKKMAVNPAFVQVVQAGGTGGTSTGTVGEHEFVAKAKAYGETNKIADALDAQAKFAGTLEGRKLYMQYQETLAPRKNA